jgi:hypothetical protein
MGAYKLSEYFAKPYFQKYWTEIHDVTTIWKKNVCNFLETLNAFDVPVEPPQNHYIAQITGHTNYARSVRQLFPSNTGLRFSREMTVTTIKPFWMLRSLCVIDMNFTSYSSYGVTKSSDNLYVPCKYKIKHKQLYHWCISKAAEGDLFTGNQSDVTVTSFSWEKGESLRTINTVRNSTLNLPN